MAASVNSSPLTSNHAQRPSPQRERELNDALLCLALATMTRGVAGCNDAVDKVMLAYDKAGGRRKAAMM
eukprot:1161189-Pelagomonas_calceolata.AAC.2